MSCWNIFGLGHFIQADLLETTSAFRDQIQRLFFMEIIVCAGPFGLLGMTLSSEIFSTQWARPKLPFEKN